MLGYVHMRSPPSYNIYLTFIAGIQNGPATGKLMSEFVFDGGAKSAKIASLDPRMIM
jgi:glycine/D-amino acid oxidase-like deaminating enzyme